MKRITVILAGLAVITFAGRAAAQDQVFHRGADKKATQTNGTIQDENANKVVVKTNLGKIQEIAASDIIEISYELRGEIRFDYRRGETAEKSAEKAATAADRRKNLEDAIKNYDAVLPKAGSSKFLARHLQYKIALLKAKLAGDNKALIGIAIEDLQKFKKENPNAWQTMGVLKMLGDLYKGQGKFEEAAGIFDDILKAPGIDKDTKAELEMSAAKFLLDAKKHGDAEKRLTTILKSYPPNDPKTTELRMMIIACQAHTNFGQAIKSLEAMIAESRGSRVAMAYNTLGECYQMNNQPKEALYNYLFVDLIYNEDRGEHIKAVENLAKLFKQMNRPERAKEYEMKLEELKK